MLKKLSCFVGLHRYKTVNDCVINVWGDVSRFKVCTLCNHSKFKTVPACFYQAEMDCISIKLMLNSLNNYANTKKI